MNILITGASGFIGQHLIRALEQENTVTACSRHPECLIRQFPKVHLLKLDFAQMQQAADWLPHLSSIDVVINAVGIIQQTSTQSFDQLHTQAPIALFRACEMANIKRVIQISALGSASNKSAVYHASKGAADEYLEILSIDWFIFRPSIVFGAGAKSMALFRALSMLPIVPLIGDGQQKVQPVYIDDLVSAVKLSVSDKLPAKQIINAVGPKPVAFAELIEKLGNWLGKSKVKTLAVPLHLSKMLAPIGYLISEPALNKQSINMLVEGNTADPSEFTKHLGYSPKSIDQVLQNTYPTQAERWHARLYLMRPVLRFSIVLVWLWAGWVSAFVYPIESSYQMLDQVGVSRSIAPFVLYGASAMDFLLGICMLMCWKLRWVVIIQTLVMLVYSVVISIALPEYWWHPFGPMIKNLPLMVATFILLTLEEQKS